MACGALLLCIYPAAVELAQPVSVVEPTAYVEQVVVEQAVVEQAVVEQAACLPSMGCNGLNCTDPTHYHTCESGCTDPAHYHTCQPDCTDSSHNHPCRQGAEGGLAYGRIGNGHHRDSGHHGGRHHR